MIQWFRRLCDTGGPGLPSVQGSPVPMEDFGQPDDDLATPDLAPKAANINEWLRHTKDWRIVKQTPKGYARICLDQSTSGSSHPLLRRFEHLTQMCIQYHALRVFDLERDLTAIITTTSSTTSTQSAPEGSVQSAPEGSVQSAPESSVQSAPEDKFEDLLKKSTEALDTYLQEYGLDEKKLQFYRNPDDFIVTRTYSNGIFHYLPYWLESHEWAKRLFIPSDPRTGEYYITSRWIKMLGTFVTVACTSFLLLTPVAILFFGDLGKIASALVVMAFSIGVPFLLHSFAEPKINHTLLAQSGIAAVLVTFLSNIRQAGGGCSC
ncbi:hypothetical protein MKZ38_008324 [Zalerion maritima]|uniref:DUF6594 domain-containing protein n=1 Tax=Zalerion maritima TaxID=339359 RepID=A0AAD5RGT5_9PEZI|nr:hypothetical protein MKZ38_008324 [Zalerion maritima]